MKITKENYEQYFIDFLDGNLSGEEIILLENFLLLNPSYRNELEGLEMTILTPDNKYFPEKDFLRRVDLSLPVSADNFDDFCVAANEGDLSENLNRNFQNYLEIHPEKFNDYLIYNQIHLVPDKNSVFPFKDELKKSVVLLNRKMIYTAISVAAALALIFIIVKQSGELTRKLDKKTAVVLPVKIETPDINPQNIKEEKVDVVITSNQRPERKKIDFKQTAINSIPVLQEKNPEINEEIYEKMTVGTMISALPLINNSVEIIIPILTAKDVIIPRTVQVIQPEEANASKPSGKYQSLAEFAQKELNEKVLDRKENKPLRASLLDLVESGLKGINLLTGSKMKLEKKTNVNGKHQILAFESKLFSFSTPVNPKE
jgi:hypothetical protein